MMTPREVAHSSGIGLLAIYAFLREGILRSVKVGTSYYVPRREYQRWLSQFERLDRVDRVDNAAA